ncbi:Zinc finger, CCHC-type [Sesbania bispinosa]|nr:Zinc finger, CCHC-type [Sesbania bispinosa]
MGKGGGPSIAGFVNPTDADSGGRRVLSYKDICLGEENEESADESMESDSDEFSGSDEERSSSKDESDDQSEAAEDDKDKNVDGDPRIGDMIGRTVKVDSNTMKPRNGVWEETVTGRGKFARLCVEVDLCRPLVSKFELLGRTYSVEYEGLHLICFGCGKYGHRSEGCPTKVQQQDIQYELSQMYMGDNQVVEARERNEPIVVPQTNVCVTNRAIDGGVCNMRPPDPPGSVWAKDSIQGGPIKDDHSNQGALIALKGVGPKPSDC